MSCAKLLFRAVLTSLTLCALTSAAQAGSLPITALPLPNRVAGAEIVVVGKVTAFEEKTVMAAPYPGAEDKKEFKIAVVTISDALLPPKGLTTVRIGFVPIPPRVRISPRPFQATLEQEGCFFLAKHAEGDFLAPAGPLSFIDKQSPTFDMDIALIKRGVKILAAPDDALKSKDAEDRLLATGMLMARYSSRKSPNDKTEPIDAEQSKRMLQTLAEADWTAANDITQMSPRMVLARLPLTAKDGWAPPAKADAKTFAAYAQKWFKDHAESYRIHRYVAEKSK